MIFQYRKVINTAEYSRKVWRRTKEIKERKAARIAWLRKLGYSILGMVAIAAVYTGNIWSWDRDRANRNPRSYVELGTFKKSDVSCWCFVACDKINVSITWKRHFDIQY